MSTITNKTLSTRNHRNFKVNIERFSSAMEVAQTCEEREITDSRFHDKVKEAGGSWDGVENYQQAIDFLRNGHQETVEAMKQKIKVNIGTQTKRFRFQNSPQGFNPIVPLALKGVPNCMIDMRMVPIKSKVVDVYYDMTCSCGTSSERIIEAGKELLQAIYELEAQGYRFNLYGMQSYTDERSADMMLVKIKSSTQPIDIKRISFPLCHTGFFRVIGFDWYSRFPKGKYRSGYGHAVASEFYNEELNEYVKQMFGNNAIYFSAQKNIHYNTEHYKEVLTNESNNK